MSTERIRSKDADTRIYKYYDSNGSLINTSDIGATLKEYFYEGSYPGSNSCYHVKADDTYVISSKRCTSAASCHNVNITNDTRLFSPTSLNIKDLLGIAYTKASNEFSSLNWNKLPTSSQFSIIQFFAELDETLALFRKETWSKVSYGQYTWGVAPFVADMKALLNTIERLSEDISNVSYENEYAVTGTEASLTESVVYDFTVRHTGTVDMSDYSSEAARLLDRLGFHPDIATVWDLIPLSFVVDYILPVGRFLEQVSRRGWVHSAHFSGWTTIKGTITRERKVYTEFSDWEPYGNFEVFLRHRNSYPLLLDTDVDPLLPELPSFKELFNILYIGLTGRR